jgi:DNA-binding GntR family transcriptional regulator
MEIPANESDLARTGERPMKRRLKIQETGRAAGPKDWNEMNEVRESLFRNVRDLLLFDLITQTNARLDALLRLKVKDLRNFRVGDEIPLSGKGSRSERVFAKNETIAETLETYLNNTGARDEDYLFKSRKGSKPLTVSSVSSLVKRWFHTSTVREVTGVKSLRKAWQIVNQNKTVKGVRPLISGDPHECLKPARKETLQEIVHTEILGGIATGRIPPGARLLTEKIAQQMNVSPMPVREALGKLEAKGFVRSQKKRGYVVNELSKESLKEIIKIRLTLESMAVEVAAIRRSDETISRLEVFNLKHRRAAMMGDVDEYFHSNKEFHHTIYQCADMPILQQMIEGLWTRMSPYLHIRGREDRGFDMDRFPNYHAHIIEALKRKDPAEASKWLRTDLSNAFSDLVDKFEWVGKGLNRVPLSLA